MKTPSLFEVFGILEGSGTTIPPGLKQETTADIYHVTTFAGSSKKENPPKQIVLKPRIPAVTHGRSDYHDPYGDNGYFQNDPWDPEEDTTTKRVCWAKTIEGAFEATGMNADGFPYDVFVYQPEHAIKVIHPSSKPLRQFFANSRDPSKWFVMDVEKTGEVWSLQPVPSKLVKIIRKRSK